MFGEGDPGEIDENGSHSPSWQRDLDKQLVSSVDGQSFQANESKSITSTSYSGQSLSMRELSSEKHVLSGSSSSIVHSYVASQEKTNALFALELKRKNMVRSEVEEMRKEVKT